MQLNLITPPILEPLTLIEIKKHLILDSGSFVDDTDNTQSIAPGLHATTTLYSLVGSAVNVAGKQAIVYLEAGENGATGTVDIKIQEYNGATWADWTGGAFTQVTTANDNATYERAYTGTASQIRVLGKVLLAACEFGVSVVTNTALTSEDDDLTDLITDARETVEKITRRGLLTQTWDYCIDDFPGEYFIKLPLGNLQTVTSLVNKDSDGISTTMVQGTDYYVETNGDQHGRVVLPYGDTWPCVTLYPSNPITIRFTCGWLTSAAIPKAIKRAVKFAAEDAYYHGDRSEVLKPVIDNLLYSHRLWGSF